VEARQLEELTGVCRHNRKTHIKPWATFALVLWHMTIVRNPTESLFGVKPPACPRLSHLAQVANGLSRGLEDAAAREQLLTKLAQVLRLELKFATLSQEEQILTYLDICILPPIVFQSLIGFFYIEEARKHFFLMWQQFWLHLTQASERNLLLGNRMYSQEMACALDHRRGNVD